MEKSCDNCKHAHRNYRDMPCLMCKTTEHSGWEPNNKEVAKEEDTGNDNK